MPVMIASASFGVIAYLAGNAVFAGYLQINFVPAPGNSPSSSGGHRRRARFPLDQRAAGRHLHGRYGSLALGA